MSNLKSVHLPALLTLLLLTLICFSSCKSSKDTNDSSDETTAVSDVYSDKVSAQIKEGISPATIEKKYAEYKLTYKGLTSKSQNIMLFTFDDSLISNEDLVKKLSKDKDVVSATSLSSITKTSNVSRSSDKKTVNPVK